MNDTVKALKQHIVSQAKSKRLDGYEKSRLRDQCRHFVRVLKQIPSTIVDEEMISKTPFTPDSYDAAMKEHDTERNLLAREDAELESHEESSDDEAEASKEDASAARLGEELKRLAASEASLNAPNTQLTQHVNVQGKCLQAKEREISQLGDKCDAMVEFAKWLPAEVRAEALLTFESAERVATAGNGYASHQT